MLGRGNSANMAYNRLLGTSGLPNLLSQQPSLYQAFQIDPNRGVANQLYPYATGMGGQSLLMPPSGSSMSGAGNSGTNAADMFGPTSNSQFNRQFAAPPPPGSTQPSSGINTVLMSQSSLMSSAIKQSAASAGIGPIGTKGGQMTGPSAYQQGGLGSLPGSGTSPLLIQYDGYVQNAAMQRSAAAAGQTAFYQALAASSQQAAAAAASTTRHQQNTFGMTGFPNQQNLVQQQLLRSQVPPQMGNHYMKQDNSGQMKANAPQQRSDAYGGNNMGGLPAHQFAGSTGGGQQQQNQTMKVATSLASMSLRTSSVMGAGGTTSNGTASTSTAPVSQGTSYSPTPIQRPPGGKGKPKNPKLASSLNMVC
jgi:hypothetical protein